jgi:sugar phosphate isomerase/epimerase
MGVPYIATMSGNMPGRRFQEQVDELVRVYNEKYFALCQQHKVRILWEPYPEGANIATGPIGYDALFKAFGNSPYVGIQWDASHLVRQFMDPIQCMRDYMDMIYNMHLKDTEIFWPVLRRCGINPPTRTRWWRYRVPGYGEVKWPEVFTIALIRGLTGQFVATVLPLDRNYRPLNADGSLGSPTDAIALRNFQGAILVSGK